MGVNGIYGLSGSGLDIESMVKVGMMSKQNEYDKMAQKFTKNEWTKAAYLELNSSITTFNNSTLSQYKMSSSMNAKEAESSSSAVKVSANASAAVMSHTVSVESLSANAYLISTNKMTRYSDNPESMELKDVLFKSITDTGSGVYGEVAPTSAGGSEQLFGMTDKTIPAHLEYYNTATSEWETVDSTNTAVKSALQTALTYGRNDGSNMGLDIRYNAGAWRYRNNQTTYADALDKILNDPVAQNILNSTSNFRYVADKTITAGDTQPIDSNQTAFSFSISDGKNTKTISYTYDQLLGTNGETAVTFNTLISDIKNKDNNPLNIQASYDSVNDRFSFYNTESGTEGGIILSFGTDDGYEKSRASLVAKNFFENMGLYQSKNGKLYNGDAEATGTYSNPLTFSMDKNKFMNTTGSINVDGVSYELKDNKATVDGVTYNALNLTTEPVRVSVTQDVDEIVNKVKSFVEDYNKLLSGLYKAYDEKPESGYAPLTQTQKDGMKEEQITKWEEKAKTGLLYHDQTIGKIINEMRNALASKVEGVDGDYNSAYSIGISTTGLKGQLVLDETKLRKALDNDSDAVYNVFAKLGNKTTTVNGQQVEDTSYNGIAQRLGDILTTANKNIKTRAGSTADITEDSDLNNLLRQLQTKMSNFKKLMNSFEDRLYKKYDAMEATLAKLGTQLNFVMGGNQ